MIFVKTYNVESYKEFNKLGGGGKIKETAPSTKERYVEDSGEISCSCALF